MEAEQEIQKAIRYEEEADEESLQPEQEIEQEECVVSEEAAEQNRERKNPMNLRLNNRVEDKSGFVHGLSVGIGIGCIATFVIMWISVFFAPQLPSVVTYEALFSIFIYPLIYLLAVGLIALTAGIVREYYVRKSSF